MIAQELEVSLHMAFVDARQQKHEFITVEHLLLALLDNPSAAEVLRSCSCDVEEIRKNLQNFIKDNTPVVSGQDEVDTQPTLGFQRVIQRAIMHVQSTSNGKKEVTGANVLVAIFGEKDSHAVYYLHQQGITRLDVVNYISHGFSKNEDSDAHQDQERIEDQSEANEERSMLSQFASNLNQLAKQGVIDPLIGRDQEIERAKAWGSRLMGSVDVATGQEVGTLAGTSVMNNQGGYAPLLDLIAKGEVGTTGAGGYNTAYRGAKISAQSMFGKNLTQLTFGELKQLQKANIADQAKRGIPASKRSSAMGRYQNIYTTLGDYMKGAGLKDTDLFSPENQDKMAIAMMRKGRFGLDNVKAGKATVGQFQNEVLARQWASIKTTGGRGRYDNDGINMASHGSASQISQAAAIAMGTMPQANIPASIAKPSNSKTTNVDVNINKVEVKSTASTITGTVNDAMTAAQNSFFQLVGSMN